MRSSAATPSTLAQDVVAEDHTYGPACALVTLVQYADFETRCCGEAYHLVRELSARFAPYLRVVFRHGPRSHDHCPAGLAAEAVEAAAEQGQFWQMHDCLFEHQSALEAVDLLEYAQRLGLDSDRFAEAICKRPYRPRIRRDQITGLRSRVLVAPAFFVNGVRVGGRAERGALFDAVLQALNAETRHLCARECGSVVEALTGLTSVSIALRDAYQRHYWRCLGLPFQTARQVCGKHAREQTELIAELSQRGSVSEELSPRSAGPAGESWHGQAIVTESELSPWLERLLGLHGLTLVTAHAVANRLAELDDADGHRWITEQLVSTNEQQAEAIAHRILGQRRRASLGSAG